jgi:hypothetical protein
MRLTVRPVPVARAQPKRPDLPLARSHPLVIAARCTLVHVEGTEVAVGITPSAPDRPGRRVLANDELREIWRSGLCDLPDRGLTALSPKIAYLTDLRERETRRESTERATAIPGTRKQDM